MADACSVLAEAQFTLRRIMLVAYHHSAEHNYYLHLYHIPANDSAIKEQLHGAETSAVEDLPSLHGPRGPAIPHHDRVGRQPVISSHTFLNKLVFREGVHGCSLSVECQLL